MLYQKDFETDDDRRPYKPGKSSSSECRAFTLLASVCSSWRLTLIGWPQSPTRHWVRHKLKKLIEREQFTMYRVVAVKNSFDTDVYTVCLCCFCLSIQHRQSH